MDAMAWPRVSPHVEREILRTLGAGGFGRVVLAREPRLGDGPERSVEVALKIVPKLSGGASL